MDKATGPSAYLLRVSTTRTDGATLFGAVPKPRWEVFRSPDRQNRVAVGNYSLLLARPEGWVLVDTGPGDGGSMGTAAEGARSRSALLRELRGLGIAPRDIALVILTHLRSEHAGGVTHCTASGRMLPTFPQARYIVQRTAWEEARSPNERHWHHYRPDDLLPLMEHSQLELIEGPAEVAEGIWVEPALGPTAGHQIVLAKEGSSTLAFLGILAPTLLHLTSGVVAASDWDPDETICSKHAVVRRALAEHWLLAPIDFERWVAAEELLTLGLWRQGTAGRAMEKQVMPSPAQEQVPVPALAV